MTREEVYQVIDSEREYQERLGVSRSEANAQKRTLEVGEYVAMLTHYVNHAASAWSQNSGNTETLHDIRKIAAICVRCMENHGAEKRLSTESEKT